MLVTFFTRSRNYIYHYGHLGLLTPSAWPRLAPISRGQLKMQICDDLYMTKKVYIHSFVSVGDTDVDAGVADPGAGGTAIETTPADGC